MTSRQLGSSVLFNNMALFSGSCFPLNGILEKGVKGLGKGKQGYGSFICSVLLQTVDI